MHKSPRISWSKPGERVRKQHFQSRGQQVYRHRGERSGQRGRVWGASEVGEQVRRHGRGWATLPGPVVPFTVWTLV